MSTKADENIIRKLQQDWMDGWANGDLAAIERILAPDFTLTVSSMPSRPVTRAQWINMLGHYTCERFVYHDMIVRLLGDIAVVSSLGQAIGARVDGADRSFPFFLTDVWARRSGGWQVVARYSSIPEGGTASSQNLDKAR